MKIIEIISIEDTRTYEEQGDRWVAIPGSGQDHECSRCGRLHEVHATVRLEDGSLAIIGTGCAKGDSMEGAIRRGASTAKTRARNQAKLAKLDARLKEVLRIMADVAALELPPVERDTVARKVGRDKGKAIPVLRMGETTVWLTGAGSEKERLEDLASSWRCDQLRKRGTYQGATYGLRAEIQKLERRLEI